MATVRFSEELKKRIIRNAERLHDSNVENMQEAGPKLWGDRIYDLVFRNTKAQMNALPEEYFETKKSFRVEGFGRENDLTIEMEMATERRWPHKVPEGEDTGIISSQRQYYAGYALDPDDDRWDDFKAEYDTFINNVVAAQKQQRDFVEGVRQVINTYKTLAPALKVWPALWDLIPTDKKDRHREIIERRKASDPVVNEEGNTVDLNSLTAAVTADKLTRGVS